MKPKLPVFSISTEHKPVFFKIMESGLETKLPVFSISTEPKPVFFKIRDLASFFDFN